MGVYIWDKSYIVDGVGVATVAAPEYGKLKIMENLNFNADAIVDPKDAEIKNLREQVESADAAATRKSQELDAILSPLFSSLEPRIDALIESRVNTLVEDALNDFEIYNYESEIGDMIDERLPEGLDDESRSEDLKAAIKEVLAGATLTMDIE
jgi:hypothetical protein